jgi:hypothetical protein
MDRYNGMQRRILGKAIENANRTMFGTLMRPTCGESANFPLPVFRAPVPHFYGVPP